MHSLVIPAAGLGTRMKSVNSRLPKELLPLGEKPAIQYAVEEGIDAGVEQIIIIISPQKEIIRRRLARLRAPIHYLYQQQPRGEADAIALAAGLVGQHSVGIIYPDNLYLPAPGALKHLQDVYDQQDADVVALTPVTQDNARAVGHSGRVDLVHRTADTYQIAHFHSKDPGHFVPRFAEELRICGIMVTGPHFFEAIRRTRKAVQRGEFTDEPVRRLLLKERGLLGVRLPGMVHDIGRPEGYYRCVNEWSKNNFSLLYP